MPTPEQKTGQPRAGRQFQEELQLRYLSPGAFTVLPPDGNPTPDPPAAPVPYRLTPSTRRHKNQSFAIIGEVDASRPSSRSPSPTGRVSPFRGRGFNPIGSRFASPNPSPPPPEDARLSPTKFSPRRTSKIPQLKKKHSSSAFGERVYHYDPSPTGTRLNTKLSQSLSNLDTKKVAIRPPPSPKKNVNSKKPAFQKLSPITGSSPDSNQSQSSPSKLPKSQSTPPSRRNSPVRNSSSAVTKPPPAKRSSRNVSRSQSRSQSRDQSRSESRETSPTKIPPTPTQIPVSKYKNVQAKVNTFNKSKPKVPPKPQVLNEQSEQSDVTNDVKTKPSLTKKESLNKLRTISKANLITKTGSNSYNINNNNTITVTTATTTTTTATLTTSSSTSSLAGKVNGRNSTKVSESGGNNITTNKSNNDFVNKTVNGKVEVKKGKDSPQKEDTKPTNQSTNGKTKNNFSGSSSPVKGSVHRTIKNVDLATDIDTSYDTKKTTDTSGDDQLSRRHGSPVKLADILPSTTTVVSSTTSTVTQPLKIDANLNISKQLDTPKHVSPIVDGRVLSATSVSNALNRMNDTVLNTQTVMRDHGLTKLSPAGTAVISAANESNKVTNPALDTRHATTALPKVEPLSIKPENIVTEITSNSNDRVNNNTNHLTHAGIISAKALEMEVQRNMHKLISPEHGKGNSVQQSINDRIKEARTMVASDVKPIRITVKEKPSDVDVQSGNVRLPVSNGLNERPGLPPADRTPPNEPEKEAPPKNACARLFSNCKRKIPCQCCKKDQGPHHKDEQPKESTGCFSCLKKKEDKEETVRINIENESDTKPSIWDKLKCCNKHKVRDASCFPGRRKDSWVERRESALSDLSQQPATSRPRCSKDCCKDFLRTIFCINLCCKRKPKEEPISRKASIISKKKSLTPTTAPPPPEDNKPKLDPTLVEYSSHMKGAIPVLPICLAWFCLIMNCIIPGTGTVLSGLFCLCLGIPRFSQKDGPKQRIGSFIINTIIGCSQFFTVLFCLVGWGWSIWWGVIMLKTARKYKKLKHLEAIEEAGSRPSPTVNQNHNSRDPERNA